MTIQVTDFSENHDTTLRTGDELLNRAHAPVLIWVPQRVMLVLGRSQKPENEADIANLERDHIPVIKRSGGGGAVILTPGCLCAALRFKSSQGFKIAEYTQKGTDLCCGFIQDHLGLVTNIRGTGDICIGNQKILGCSLRLKKDFALYYGVMAVQDILPEVVTYLAHPTREPDYRQGRDHRQFLTNLQAHSPGPLNIQPLCIQLEQYVRDNCKGLDWG